MNAEMLTVNVRILVGGKAPPPLWRMKFVAFVARILGVPIDVVSE